jgi:hypothetical protein
MFACCGQFAGLAASIQAILPHVAERHRRVENRVGYPAQYASIASCSPSTVEYPNAVAAASRPPNFFASAENARSVTVFRPWHAGERDRQDRCSTSIALAVACGEGDGCIVNPRIEAADVDKRKGHGNWGRCGRARGKGSVEPSRNPGYRVIHAADCGSQLILERRGGEWPSLGARGGHVGCRENLQYGNLGSAAKHARAVNTQNNSAVIDRNRLLQIRIRREENYGKIGYTTDLAGI